MVNVEHVVVHIVDEKGAVRRGSLSSLLDQILVRLGRLEKAKKPVHKKKPLALR